VLQSKKPGDNLETFGAWLRHQRNQIPLTREQFAERVGCSVALLRKIEDGERRPSTQIAELIANTLNIPAADRATFVRVARGELNLERLPAVLKPVSIPIVPAAPRVNLPVLPTPLIGRQRDVEELSQLLRDPHCRLLTLAGPGGMGKTRLAIETAKHSQALFDDGVYFVPLASVSAIRFIVPVMADAIGFTFQSASLIDPQTQLFNYLREKQLLLVVDNLEHLLGEPGIEVLADLLASAPRIKLLATSRESVGLQDEWVFEVQGLPIPDSRSTDSSAHNTSVELFLQRARRAHVSFQAMPQDYPAIIRICQLVNGMPLGLELAAAWVRTLTCQEIAQEIERGLDFLSVSTRDLPARHRSMRAVFDHSWRLLTAEEQTALLRLSLFQGGFRREAAEQVAGATLAVLSTLVTKSLIRHSGDGRYDLHELIRQFAAEHFSDRAPEEQAATRSRHGRYYLTSFSQADSRLRSAAQRETLAELTVEMDNFRSAWDWAVAQGEFALIEQVMRVCATLYDIRGWLLEGLDTLGRACHALEMAHESAPIDRTHQIALGHILIARGVLASRLGQLDQAQAMLERSLQILRPWHEPRVLVEAVTYLGNVMEFIGNYPRAAELYSEGLAIATAVGDRWFTALCRFCLAGEGITRALGNPESSYEQLKSVVAEWRSIGDPRLTAIALNTLSLMAVLLGRYDEARTPLEESVVLNTSIGDRWNLGFAYRGLGFIAQAQGEHQQALEFFDKTLVLFKEISARQDMARVLTEMSYSFLALDHAAEAERVLHEAVRITHETQSLFVLLAALIGLAAVKANRGEAEQALELSLIVLNHPASLPDSKNRAEHLRNELAAQLTKQQVETIQTLTQGRTLEATVVEILSRIEFEL
jgi:predicted ATPase/transcriptional regulator with XRE-family HTH domain